MFAGERFHSREVQIELGNKQTIIQQKMVASSGKRYSETYKKVAQGRARKRHQEWEKRQNEKEQLELEEAAKWEDGTRKPNAKKLAAEQKKKEQKLAKQQRRELLKAEEHAIEFGPEKETY